MIYEFEHNNQLMQGDICWKLPMLTPEFMRQETLERDGSIWENYTQTVKEGEETSFKLVIMPNIVEGVVLSQTCDIRAGRNIVFGRILPLIRDPKTRIARIPNQIKDILRHQTQSHYLPNPRHNEELFHFNGPYIIDFQSLFILPAEMILMNLDIYWRARMIPHARKVLCDKIQSLFTRLAYDDVIFFTNEEIKAYVSTIQKNKTPITIEIKRALREVGRENDIPLIFE